jgi:exoribonuclease R
MWTIDLGADGAASATRVERVTIRNRVALSFSTVQQQLDAGTADEPLVLLREIGTLRRDLEAARGGISLDLPAQEVEAVPEGGYTLVYRAPLPVETWNAQISLLTGMQAAQLMIGAHVGILRTLPPPQPSQITRLRRRAGALHIGWPKETSWGALANRLDRSKPPDAAFLIQATHVLRGAGYAVLDAKNATDLGAIPVHAGVAAPYAHVTAPLRRLGDRYANEIVLSACAGTTPPEWATAALDEVATAMESANRHSAQIERAVIDAVECVLLLPNVATNFEAVVVDRNEHGAVVQLTQPAVVAAMASDATIGERITVRLEAVDPVARRLQFRPA